MTRGTAGPQGRPSDDPRPRPEVEGYVKFWCGLRLYAQDPPVVKTGAVGKLNSVYIRDPDGNLVEISNYVETG